MAELAYSASSVTFADMLPKMQGDHDTAYYDSLADDPFFKNRRNCEVFLGAIYNGTAVHRDLIRGFARVFSDDVILSQAMDRDSRWSEEGGVSDDNFTPAGFLLWWFYRGTFNESVGYDQLLRMLALGRIDLKFAREFFRGDMMSKERLRSYYGRYAAHDDLAYSLLLGRVRKIIATYGSASAIHYQRALEHADRERMLAFRNNWLPAVLTAAELEEARELHPSILKSLYAKVWSGGYEAYHAVQKAAGLVPEG